MAINLQEALNYDIKKAEKEIDECVLGTGGLNDTCDADYARKALDVVEVLQAALKESRLMNIEANTRAEGIIEVQKIKIEGLQAEVKRLTTQTRGIAELLILCITGEESCVPEAELDQHVSTRQAILTALSLKDELASEKILAYCSVAATEYDANRTFKALRELISEGRIKLARGYYFLTETDKK